MKKTICILLTAVMLFAFAACSKNKGEPYVEPPTEVITFADGETAVYEVVTDAQGEKVTKENGENEVIPYDPPVTEKGGYLVTDPEGSTIKQSATTAQTAVVEKEDIDLNDPDTPANGTTAPIQTKPGETTAQTTSGKKDPATSSDSNSPLVPGEDIEVVTTKNQTAKPTEKVTMAPDLPEDQTGEFGTEISKADAEKLYNILNFKNTFDQALCIPDYNKAATELPVYMGNVENAVAQIKADKTLYQYVGNENLNLWLSYMQEVEDKYTIFLNIYNEIKDEDEYPKSFYAAYEDFQNSYRSALKIYYTVRTNAEAIMYSYNVVG